MHVCSIGSERINQVGKLKDGPRLFLGRTLVILGVGDRFLNNARAARALLAVRRVIGVIGGGAVGTIARNGSGDETKSDRG